MKLCMFTPKDLDLQRGWPGRIEGDRVVQVAAQTLQAFFTGGGTAREHAQYPLRAVRLLSPVLHPPSIRIFDGPDFCFGNPASVYRPDEDIPFPDGADALDSELRLAAIIGADERIGGFTIMNELCAPALEGAKARDFAVSLGPIVVTPDELVPLDVPWDDLVDYARRHTKLVPGDVIAADPVSVRRELRPGDVVALEVEGIGTLRNRIA